MMDHLLGLNPVLVTKITAVLAQMQESGQPMIVVQGVRTADYQHSLWLKGRDPAHPGPTVTNCDGYHIKSRHQVAPDGLGRAVDCAFTGPDPFNLHHPWAAYGAAVEAQGLVWGGRFSHPIDLDHAELPTVA